ncbi:hypothetical protein KIN20_020566 [Parelaphostrongylus tenuis]|uniref:Secreted protein n=1 Tax=Parelaphostrongylus tenuis TaxID=148309 RepID=A0AAD5N9X4_PARTN|nr:hypothetical protein KIN20_020566 [Parelaphostrongylus tenuis]
MTSSTVGLSFTLFVMLILTEAYPSSKESQRYLADVFKCVHRLPEISPEFATATEAELMLECSAILQQHSNRETRCFFSPIRCLFQPGHQPEDGDNDDDRR